MKPWHLHEKAVRDNVIDWLSGHVDEPRDECEVAAAIALLAAAAPYGDDELVVRDINDGEHVWIVGWDVMVTGTPVLVIVSSYGEFCLRTEEAEALTPAADSLLRALRGES